MRTPWNFLLTWSQRVSRCVNLFNKFKNSRMHVRNLSDWLKVKEFTALTTSKLVSQYEGRQAQQCAEWPEALETS